MRVRKQGRMPANAELRYNVPICHETRQCLDKMAQPLSEILWTGSQRPGAYSVRAVQAGDATTKLPLDPLCTIPRDGSRDLGHIQRRSQAFRSRTKPEPPLLISDAIRVNEFTSLFGSILVPMKAFHDACTLTET
jgi:hypothetical protein